MVCSGEAVDASPKDGGAAAAMQRGVRRAETPVA
jgi:hypothetical protein